MREPNAALLLGPRIGRRLGEAGDREICRRGPGAAGRKWLGSGKSIRNSRTCITNALEFPDGTIVLLTRLCQGQQATVLQLPAAPRTAEEAEEQKRVAVVA